MRLLKIIVFCYVFSCGVNAFEGLDMHDCNTMEKGVSYQLSSDLGYCLETGLSNNTFVNLPSYNIEKADLLKNSVILYPNEYLFTTSQFALYNVEGLIVTWEKEDIIVARDRVISHGIEARAFPILVAVPSILGGAVVGVGYAVVDSGFNPTYRDIAIGAFSGGITGGLSLITGGGFFGIATSGGAGIAAYGGCKSCH